MSRVKRRWGLDEKPVNLYTLAGACGVVAIGFWCPRCRRHLELEPNDKNMHIICPCGQHLGIILEVTLEELEEEEVKGE